MMAPKEEITLFVHARQGLALDSLSLRKVTMLNAEFNVIKSYLGVENRTYAPNCKPLRWLHCQMPELTKHHSAFTLV